MAKLVSLLVKSLVILFNYVSLSFLIFLSSSMCFSCLPFVINAADIFPRSFALKNSSSLRDWLRSTLYDHFIQDLYFLKVFTCDMCENINRSSNKVSAPNLWDARHQSKWKVVSDKIGLVSYKHRQLVQHKSTRKKLWGSFHVPLQ